jgi:hypothetical protein
MWRVLGTPLFFRGPPVACRALSRLLVAAVCRVWWFVVSSFSVSASGRLSLRRGSSSFWSWALSSGAGRRRVLVPSSLGGLAPAPFGAAPLWVASFCLGCSVS